MDVGIIALATLVTVARVMMLIGVAIVSGWTLAYISIKSHWFERIYIPIVNVLESIPVIAFFPLVLVVFINGLGGATGVEVAADFLVFTAVAWNIWIGIYQAFKTIPGDLLEIAENYEFGFFRIMKDLYIPHSIPRISSNLFSSFASAMFYITVSEVFSVGTTTYKTFGIGTVLTTFLAEGSAGSIGVYYSLFFIAIAIIIMTNIFSRFSNWSIAKYGMNTEVVIKRRTGLLQKYLQREEQFIIKEFKTVSRLVSGNKETMPSVPLENPYARHHLLNKTEVRYIEYIAKALALLALAYVLYGLYGIASAVPETQWIGFMTQTPSLLLNMGADYVRVIIITLVSLVFAVFAGYFLVTHTKFKRAADPVIQTAAAFPAPAYFPLLFIATLPFLQSWFPSFYSEIYILLLGFLSCFFYVFFDFCTGVQSIPLEFWEVMRNYKMGYLTKMRYVVLPSTMPYLVTGISNTINSAWAGIAIAEYWPNIYGNHTLTTSIGMMRYISLNMASGQVANAAWVSILFACVVILYGVFFTKKLIEIAREKFVVEDGIYSG